MMRRYSPYIDPYIRMIKENKVEHCKEQDLMIDNLVIPVLVMFQTEFAILF